MVSPADYLDLYDYRLRVIALYQQRNEALRSGRDPEETLDTFRQNRDVLFSTHPQSALAPDQKQRFSGLPYFPYNLAACVEAIVDADVAPQRLFVHASGDEVMPMSRAAALHFVWQGQQASLSMYWIDVYGGGLFLPFHDATAPDETYGAGRYLFDTVKGSDFLSLPSNGGLRRILLDFNYAYNPSCAYNPRWVCPLAPPENRLPFPIRAGERKYPDHGVLA